ncbi:hypothetical protein FIBSPDRAFT_909115 [Athelia psychrophila]|uniref:Phosphoglycerate mutase family protein n=1 Tax=Athelia psychrophila TaxID=1759441 RepID=A0A166Q7B2_9AGAM|nr:hypothetical protein FIBSPDRAFT_909115 [Fibularhizoctonia sp. CBS 109695]
MFGPKQFAFTLLASSAFVAASYDNTLYLIRHGEKPSNGSDGLSAQGVERAQCLRTVFGDSSSYDIGYIMAETPKSDGSRARPYDTVLPLATDLGITIDTSCSKTDAKCVKKAVKAYAGTSGSKNVLICWEHGELTDIASELGVSKAPDYPDASFNLIWTVQDQDLISTTSEDCPGLDSS